MASFVSPGVYVVEKDISDYTPAVNPTVVGVVGFATKGPVNVPTLITSQENLIRAFGRPTDDLAGQGIEGALEILETANQTYYVRGAVPDGPNAATVAAGNVEVGTCPNTTIANSVGVTADKTHVIRVQVTDSNGVKQYAVPRDFYVPFGGTVADGFTSFGEVFKAIGGNLDGDKVGIHKDGTATAIVGFAAGANAELGVSGFEVAADGTLAEAPIIGGANTKDVIGTTTVAVGTANGVSYVVNSLWPGTGYNTATLPDGSIVGNSISVQSVGGGNNILNVNENGIADESFKVSFQASGSQITEVINTGNVDPTSEFIKGSFFVGTGLQPVTLEDHPFNASIGTIFFGTDVTNTNKFAKLVGGTTLLADGTNGDGTNEDEETAALIGVVNETGRTGLQALLNETVPITIGIVPGITSQAVQNELVTLAERSGDFLAVLGTPIGVGGVGDAIAFANGQTTGRTAALNSSYAALYFPAVKVYQPTMRKDIWMDPAIFAVRQMGYTDTVSDLWFAPAGFSRGRLTKPVDTEVDINQGDRDSMYSGGNVVNPIVNFPLQGITIFGQRTTQRAPTALDRINVRRLMIYIKRVITASTQRFVFEPNDKVTQERIQQLLVPLFEDIKRRRGITEFKVVCDETVNTPVRVDRNELWCKVLIKPTKAAEVLVFELNITNQSASLG